MFYFHQPLNYHPTNNRVFNNKSRIRFLLTFFRWIVTLNWTQKAEKGALRRRKANWGTAGCPSCRSDSISGDTAGLQRLIRRTFSCLGSGCSQAPSQLLAHPALTSLMCSEPKRSRGSVETALNTPTDGTFQSRQHLTAGAAASHVSLIKSISPRLWRLICLSAVSSHCGAPLSRLSLQICAQSREKAFSDKKENGVISWRRYSATEWQDNGCQADCKCSLFRV